MRYLPVLAALLLSVPARAQIPLCASTPKMPAACLADIPAGASDPFIPGATMCRGSDTSVRFVSCLMTRTLNPPMDGSWYLETAFAVFGPDARTREGRLIALGGQGGCLVPAPTKQCGYAPQPGAHPGVLVIETAVDIGDIPPDDLKVGWRKVLVQSSFSRPLAGSWSQPVPAGLSLLTNSEAP